jgi:hypothetical protein
MTTSGSWYDVTSPLLLTLLVLLLMLLLWRSLFAAFSPGSFEAGTEPLRTVPLLLA